MSTTTVVAAPSAANPLARFGRHRAEIARVALLVAVLAFFGFTQTGFFDTGNLFSLMQAFALLGLVTAGLCLTMIAGEFDLSVGSVVAAAGIIAIKAGESSPVVGLLVAVAFGIAVGVLNGAIVVLLRVSSLVVTVGTQIVVAGIAYGVAQGKVVAYENYAVATDVDQVIASIFSPRSLVAVAAFVAIWAMLRYTRLGRDIIATGSSRDAANAAGARTRSSLIGVFAISGACAALAGTLLAFSLLSGSPTTGSSVLLQAVSAAILGGVALSGGIGKIGGVVVGVLVLVALNNGLSFMGASDAAVSLANGLLLLAVVTISAGGPAQLIAALRRRIGAA